MASTSKEGSGSQPDVGLSSRDQGKDMVEVATKFRAKLTEIVAEVDKLDVDCSPNVSLNSTNSHSSLKIF